MVNGSAKPQTGKRTETTATQRIEVFTEARLYSPSGAPSIAFQRSPRPDAPLSLRRVQSWQAGRNINYRSSGERVGGVFSFIFRFSIFSCLPGSGMQELILSLCRKVWSLAKRLAILGHFLQANDGGKIMLHLIWYILVGLIAGIIAKSVMHVHMTIFWTIVLGIIGSIIGGAVTHLFSPPTGRFHPAGIIFSTLGAILVLYLCIKLHIRFPRVL
jgi:uncharacterized membrane protein YeaQ/YmgE (transglycosylase-associated protein family)